MEKFTVKLFNDKGEEVETFVTQTSAKKEKLSYYKKLLSPSDQASSKRFIALQLIYLAMITFVLDALKYMIINTEVTISILAAGVTILLGTTAEKMTMYRNMNRFGNNSGSNDVLFDNDDNPTIIN